MPARTVRRNRRKVHPIWRGIGCAFMVIIPIISWGISETLFPQFQDELPAILTAPLDAPGVVQIQAFWGRALLTGLVAVVLFFALTLIGSALYSLMGGVKNEEEAAMKKRNPFRY